METNTSPYPLQLTGELSPRLSRTSGSPSGYWRYRGLRDGTYAWPSK